MLSLNNITYHIGGRTILEDVQLQLDSGHRGGLIGRNGSGKSTLFKIILGEIEADTGQIQIAKNLRIVTVAQEVPHGELTPVEYLLNSDIERKTLMDELETCDDPNRLGDIYDRLISMDAYSADSRASIILKGLGFSEEDQKKQLSEFSGGFRMRIALAAALFRNPDLLLLDEPTNHLDFESILWLEEFLQKYTGSLLLISHDREFLNKVTNHIFHLNKGKVITYKGNYDVYEQKYRLQLEADISYNKKIEAQKAHMQKFVDRFKAKATKAKQAQSRVKAINKLNPIALIFEDPAIRLNFPEVEKLPSPIISYDKLNIGYDNIPVLKHVGGSIMSDDRIALLGANGNGKSTFAKLLAKELKPQSGEFTMYEKLRIGYFNQHQYENLELDRTPIDHLTKIMVGQSEMNVRTHLGSFGFQREKATTLVGKLSGGEKARLVFSMITCLKPHILILDEPTNHLDIDMRESLIFAINDFNGAVILISHDLHLIENTIDKLWIVKDQKIGPFNGSIEEYRDSLLK